MERPTISEHLREEDVQARMRSDADVKRTMRQSLGGAAIGILAAYVTRDAPDYWEVAVGALFWVVGWWIIHGLSFQYRRERTQKEMYLERLQRANQNISVMVAVLPNAANEHGYEVLERLFRENADLKEGLASATRSEADTKVLLARYDRAWKHAGEVNKEIAKTASDHMRLVATYHETITGAQDALAVPAPPSPGLPLTNPKTPNERIADAQSILTAGLARDPLGVAVAVALSKRLGPPDPKLLKKLGRVMLPKPDNEEAPDREFGSGDRGT